MPTKAERLAEFFRRLRAAAPAASEAAALALVRHTLDAVEDELSGVAHDSKVARIRLQSERMYPPLADSEVTSTVSGTRCFSTARHAIFVAPNGAIMIRHQITLHVELSKVGADGKAIDS